MTSSTLRATALLVALTLGGAALLATSSTAAADTTEDLAASALPLGSATTTELPASGDITAALKKAVATAGTPYQANVVHLPAGSVTVSAMVRPANHVHIVAEPGTTITWRGSETYLLRFAPGVTASVTGGTWNGSGRSTTTLIGTAGATVQLANLTVTRAGKYGIVGYAGSTLTLRNVTSSHNAADGVHIEDSTLDASGLRSLYNRRNGVQLSAGSVGTIHSSTLDHNGQAVRGSTTGKTGHGLGVASSRVTVRTTSASKNKVCGVSLSGSAAADISGSHLDNNGRHGLGTVLGTRATISDSAVNNNDHHGVLASGSRTLVTLQRVTIDAARKSGLSVTSRARATISGTTFSRGQKNNISVSARGSITISGDANRVTTSRADGLKLTGSGTTGRILGSTAFMSNRGSGILVASKAKLWMVPCEFSGNKANVSKRAGGKVTKLG